MGTFLFRLRNAAEEEYHMRTLLRALLLCLLVPTAIAFSQDKPPAAAPAASPADPLSTFNKMVYSGVKGILLRSAEKMPEENYAFKPTEAVRSYGQIIGHVADSQYYFCSLALGEANPALQIEKTKTSKADLIAALKGAFSYCDKAYDGMTDASATQTVTLFGGPTPKIGVLEVNLLHSMEHYGNLVTYMRMKNIIPPTSEPGAMPKP
jgi:uncharacterized damage-inducible protein DinB